MRGAAEPGGQRFERGFGAGDQGDARACLLRTDRELLADAARRARDEDPLAGELQRALSALGEGDAGTFAAPRVIGTSAHPLRSRGSSSTNEKVQTRRC